MKAENEIVNQRRKRFELPSKMAESSESSGLDKQLMSAKSETPKDTKKKRKRSKKFGRAKFSEKSETKSQESLTGCMDGEGENKEDPEANVAESKETLTETGQSSEAVEEGTSAQERDKIETEGTKQDEDDELVNKDSPQDSNVIEESRDQNQETKADVSTEKDTNKKIRRRSLNFLRASRKTSKSKLSSGGAERDEDQVNKASENKNVKAKASGKEDEPNEEQEDIKDEEKIEQDATCEDAEGKDEDNSSPEGTLERPLGKSNKERKSKRFASFGRNKKKPEIAIKQKENELAGGETGELEKEEKSDARSSERKSQNIGSESNEPAILDKNDSLNEPVDKGKEDNEEKQSGNVKRKSSLLGFKRNKQQSKKQRSSKNEDQLTTEERDQRETTASKTDDVGITKGERLKGESEGNGEELIKGKEDDKSEEKTAVPLDTRKMEGSNKEEIGDFDEEANQETIGDEETSQASFAKNRKSKILRSFRKLKSPKKKMQENEKTPGTYEDDAKKPEQLDQSDNSEFAQSTEEQKAADEIDEEYSFNTMKRKTSDLKNIGLVQAMKRKKEDNTDGDVFLGPTTHDDAQDEKKPSDKTRENTNKLVNESVQFSDKKEKEKAEEDEEGTEDESYDSDLTFVSEITVLSSPYELAGEQKARQKNKDEEFRGSFVKESANSNRLQLVEDVTEDGPEPNAEKYEEHKNTAKTMTADAKESSVNESSEDAEPEVKAEITELVAKNEEEYQPNKLEETLAPVNQGTEVLSSPDGLQSTEPSEESKVQQNTEDTEESSKTETRDADDENKSDSEISTQEDDLDINKSKADKDKKSSFSTNPKAWIMVQHLEMNEDITRQLGNMLSINAFKRTTTCCTIL